MSRSSPSTTRESRAAEMRRIVRAFEGSGLSRAEYCRTRKVPLSTFHYWRRRLVASTAFVEVEVTGAGPESGPSRIEITAPGGAVIRLGLDAGEDLIRRVLRAAAPC